jgi:hypothetical protein
MWYAEGTKMRYDAVDRTFCDAIKPGVFSSALNPAVPCPDS